MYDEFGDSVIISIMNQYTPVGEQSLDELNRRVTAEEYDEVIEYAISIGIQNAFIQEEGTQEESFIPEFNGEGIV